MELIFRISAALLLLTAVACGGGTLPPSTAAGGVGVGVGTGGATDGGAPAPPAPATDGAAWFIVNASAVTGTVPAAAVDFSALQNTVQGGIPIGSSRTAQLLVYNSSKKTPLMLTEAAVIGPDAADFAVAPASVQGALGIAFPVGQGPAFSLQVVFTARAEGARAATLRLVSNAGTALVPLAGMGLPARPILVATAGLDFLASSAPGTVVIANQGGEVLSLASIALAGASPGSFQFTVANHGLGTCFAGLGLGPHAFCSLGIGVAPGAPAPSSALLVIRSNDPVHPETDVPLTLSP